MFNILSQITLKVKFLRNKEQHCLLPSLVDDFTCVHPKNTLLTHILSTLFSSTSVLFSCTPFGTKSINMHVGVQMCRCVLHMQMLTIPPAPPFVAKYPDPLTSAEMVPLAANRQIWLGLPVIRFCREMAKPWTGVSLVKSFPSTRMSDTPRQSWGIPLL